MRLVVSPFATVSVFYIWPFGQFHAIECNNCEIKRGMAGLRARLKKTVVLVGMMGAGKTAVGKALAARLDVPFLDSDEEIVKAADRSIAEIFSRDGEAFFRDRETEVIKRLLHEEIGILSTGGGAYLAERNRTAISKEGVAIWLRADLDLLWARVRHKTSRPLLRTDNPFKTLSELFALRDPLYAKAELAVRCHAHYSIEEMATEVIKTLKTRPDVMEISDDG